MLKDHSVLEISQELAKTVQSLYRQGWCPATSSNFSVRLPPPYECILISQSGVDKEYFSPEHVMLVDSNGRAMEPKHAKPSAETLIHTTLYQHLNTNAVLHTHSIDGTICSRLFAPQGCIEFQGYEVLKGLKYHNTHEAQETVPILPNSQDMEEFSEKLKRHLTSTPLLIHGFLIEGHGFYTWGDTLSEAKRHLEVFEFLFSCTVKTPQLTK